jgi:polysaccharide transporter, PST family
MVRTSTNEGEVAPPHMALKTEIARGLKWQAISIVGAQLLALVVFTTLVRLLEPSAFGLVGLIGASLGFIGMLADQGIRTALIQRPNLDAEHLDTAFWFNLGCSSLLCVGTSAFAGPLSALLGDPRLASPLQWCSLGLVFTALSQVHSTLLIKAMDFRLPTIQALIGNVVGGAIGVAMALAGYGIWALVVQQLAASLAGAIFVWAASPYRPSLRFSTRHLGELLGVSSSTFATSLLWFLTCRIDQFVIGGIAGVSTLGLYVVGSKIPDMAKKISHEPLAAVSLPTLSKIQDDRNQMRQTIYAGMELNATVSFAIFGGLAVISSDLVPLLFGSRWAAAAGMSSLLSIYALISVLQVFLHPALVASGGVGKYVLLNVWHLAGAFLASVVGIQFGLSYLVLGLVTNSLILSVPSLLFLRNRIGLNPLQYWRPCLVPGAASLLMGAMVWLTTAVLPGEIAPALRLTCQICIGAATYLGCISLFAPSTLRKLVDAAGHVVGRQSNSLAAPPSS